MTACVKCGHDPEAVVLASWTLHVPREVRSGNAYVVNSGGARFGYKRERDSWERDFTILRGQHGVTLATCRRRVTLTRSIGYRQRAYDKDNLVAGCKPVIDALVRAGLLLGDTERHVELHFAQERRPQFGTIVLIEELADAG